jgi:diguanylate cyclase (GGDEF)-like protein
VTTQILLLAALVAVVVVALYLIKYLTSNRSGHRRGPSFDQFSQVVDLFFLNSSGGKIQPVASAVSDILQSAGQCDKILFLRKQRGMLDLNYYHGIYRFDRAEFRIPYRPELAARLSQSLSPQLVEALGELIPHPVRNRLKAEGLQWFVPVFWRENFYGLYFLRTNLDPRDPSFALMASSLAHVLSAAYHVRWHEARLEKVAQSPDSHQTDGVDGYRETSRDVLPILKLVRHANMETLLPHLADTMQHQVGASRLLLVYENDTHSDPQIAKSGMTGRLDIPNRDTFNRILESVSEERIVALEGLNSSQDAWLRHMRQLGFKSVARFLLNEGRRAFVLLDGSHKSPDVSNRLVELESSAQALIANAELMAQMQELSFTDSLTGLSNQRYFRKRLKEEIDRARRYNRSLALIIFDLDDLKRVNDSYGHLAGDEVIRRLGPILRGSIRAIDIVARYGGDEFCVIMPEADDAICVRFMERLNLRLSGYRFQLPGISTDISCTISLGGAIFPSQASNDDELIFAADMALLQAKASGRNRFLLFSPATTISDGTPPGTAGF